MYGSLKRKGEKKMKDIKWTRKMECYRTINLKDCAVEIYTNNSDMMAFKFLKGCHKTLTRTRCLFVGYAESQEDNFKRIYFQEAMPGEGYTINEFRGGTANSILQMKNSANTELYDAVKKYSGKYLIKDGHYKAKRVFYIDLLEEKNNVIISESPTESEEEVKNEKTINEIVENIEKQHEAQSEDYHEFYKKKVEVLLDGLNKMFQLQASQLEAINSVAERLNQMNSDVHKTAERAAQIFTEVKYNRP